MAKRRKAKRVPARKSKSFLSPLKLFWVFALALVVTGVFAANDRSTRTVLGVATSAYRSGLVRWAPVPGAVKYNIYYKKDSDKSYIHSVRGLSASTTAYTIDFLKKDANYWYTVKALSASGREFWTSDAKVISATQ